MFSFRGPRLILRAFFCTQINNYLKKVCKNFAYMISFVLLCVNN